MGAIPVLRQRRKLPIVADPSHTAGAHPYVTPMALVAIATGADGLLVEVHANPDKAYCDGDQALSPGTLMDLVSGVAAALRDE